MGNVTTELQEKWQKVRESKMKLGQTPTKQQLKAHHKLLVDWADLHKKVRLHGDI